MRDVRVVAVTVRASTAIAPRPHPSSRTTNSSGADVRAAASRVRGRARTVAPTVIEAFCACAKPGTVIAMTPQSTNDARFHVMTRSLGS